MNRTICILLCFFPLLAFSQQEDSPFIAAKYEFRQDSVFVRFAPSSADSWAVLNKYGVRIERITLVRNGEILVKPDTLLLSEVYKPELDDNFIALAKQNSFAAIIAQGLYGDSFQVTGQGEISTIIAKSKEKEQRFALSLYAADLCFECAIAAKWGFVDSKINKNENYLYKITPLVPESEIKIKEGSAFVFTDKEQRLPKPLDFQAYFANGSAILSWNYRTLDYLYNSYMLQRSVDGVNFSDISETPLTKMDANSSQIMYLDSIGVNKTYYYRIYGRTIFGGKSAFSDTLSGKCFRKLSSPPIIIKAVPNDNEGAFLEWQVDSLDTDMIKTFTLHHSPNDKNYTARISNIAPKERSITVPKIEESNYFILEAIGEDGQGLKSFATFVQAIDTLPPPTPQGLKGEIDTLGRVKLSWIANNDSDTYGYKIYRGQTAAEELVPLTDIAVMGDSFVDSISVRNLNSQVFYAISALDKRYNQSDLCATVAIQKPALIPPTPPIISIGQARGSAIYIEWLCGIEDNLAAFEIYRKSDKDTDYKLLAKTKDASTLNFEDESIAAGVQYFYQIKALNSSNLSSELSPSYAVMAAKNITKNQGSELKLEIINNSVKIIWNCKINNVTNLQLYKKAGEETLSLMREGLSAKGSLIDNNIIPNKIYEYVLVIKSSGSSPVNLKKTIKL